MAAKYILAALAALFVVMGVRRGDLSHPQSRASLTIGAIFSAVSAWLFFRD